MDARKFPNGTKIVALPVYEVHDDEPLFLEETLEVSVDAFIRAIKDAQQVKL